MLRKQQRPPRPRVHRHTGNGNTRSESNPVHSRYGGIRVAGGALVSAPAGVCVCVCPISSAKVSSPQSDPGSLAERINGLAVLETGGDRDGAGWLAGRPTAHSPRRIRRPPSPQFPVPVRGTRRRGNPVQPAPGLGSFHCSAALQWSRSRKFPICSACRNMSNNTQAQGSAAQGKERTEATCWSGHHRRSHLIIVFCVLYARETKPNPCSPSVPSTSTTQYRSSASVSGRGGRSTYKYAR